jgi:hypothetical protein
MVELVNTLTNEHRTTGANEAIAAVEKVQAGLKKEGIEADNTAIKLEKLSRSHLSIESGAKRFVTANDPIAASLAKVQRGETLLDQARKQGQQNLVNSLMPALANAKKHHEELSGAMNDNGKAMGLNRMQIMESAHVMRSLADEVAAGANPLRALALEGGRIGQIFAEGQGGVTGTLKAMGGALLSLVNPWVAVGGAVAGASVIAVASIMRWEDAQNKLAISLNALGRGSGLSLSGATTMATQAGQTAGISTATSMGLAGQYLGAGISGGNVPGAIGITKPFGEKLGLPMEEASAKLAEAFKDPVKGAKDLGDNLGLLTFYQKHEIETLYNTGDAAGATAKLIGDVSDQLKIMSDPSGVLVKAKKDWENLGVSVSDALSGLGKWALTPMNLTGARPVSTLEGNIGAYDFDRQKAAAATKEQQDRQNKVASDLAQQTAPLIAKMFPDVATLQKLAEQAELLKRDLGTEGVAGQLRAIGGSASTLNEALSRTQSAISNWRSEAEKTIESARLSAAETLADSFAEKEAAATTRAYTEAIRANKTEVEASAAAEAERTRLLAAGQDALDKYKSSIDDQIKTMGMKPLQAGIEGIIQKWDELSKSLASGSEHAKIAKQSTDALSKAQDDASKTMESAYSREVKAMVAQAGKEGLQNATSLQKQVGPPSDFSRIETEGKYKSLMTTAAPSAALAVPARAIAPMPEIDQNQIAEGWKKTAESIAAYTKEMAAAPIREANQNLQTQQRLLDAEAASFGKTTEEATRLKKIAELLNAEDAKGITVGSSLVAEINKTADAYAKQAKQAEETKKAQQQLIAVMDDIRSVGTTALDTFAGDLEKGDRAAKALKDTLQSVLKTVEQMATKSLMSSMFGQAGTPGLGGLGGLSGMFSGLGGAAGTTGVAAGTADVAAGTTGGAAVGADVLAVASGLFAGGGIMSRAGPMPLKFYQTGGIARHPQAAVFGEGSNPEAYIPLPDGRSVPVSMRGGGQSPNVTIHNYAGVNVEPRITKSGMEIHVRDAIMQNNNRLPGLLSDYAKRSS